MDPSVIVVFMLLCGGIAAVIGNAKHRGILGSFVLGALFGVFGILGVALMARGLPKAPLGMRAVKCPRCNAVQNVSTDGQTTFECWQCKTTSQVPQFAPPPGRSEDTREWLDRVKKNNF